MTLQEFKEFNTKVSSEMFFSLMSLLHGSLPCAPNFFRMKKNYRSNLSTGFNGRKS
jgi:hypothetical protein